MNLSRRLDRAAGRTLPSHLEAGQRAMSAGHAARRDGNNEEALRFYRSAAQHFLESHARPAASWRRQAAAAIADVTEVQS